MIETHLKSLCEEFQLETPAPFDNNHTTEFTLATFRIRLVQTEKGAHLSAPFAKFQPKHAEALLTKMMEANFLGQGTGGGVLGMKEDETFLTLSLDLPYEVNYTSFKGAVEEFVNYLEYWKTEAAKS